MNFKPHRGYIFSKMEGLEGRNCLTNKNFLILYIVVIVEMNTIFRR
jgi:hypothetical protein